MMGPPRRRESDKPWVVRTCDFIIAPLVDGGRGVSITRLLCLVFAALLWHAIEESHPVTSNQLFMMLGIMAAAFGKSTYSFFLQRTSLRSTSQQRDVKEEVKVTVDETRRLIEERRGSLPFEPAP